MNRYEQILTQLVAAQVATGWPISVAAESPTTRRAAMILEAHFVERERAELQPRMPRCGVPVDAISNLLKPQAG